MVRIATLVASALLPCAIWGSSIPKRASNTTLLDITVDDILNAPVKITTNGAAPPPSTTSVAIGAATPLPGFLNSAVSSIVAVAATATGTGGHPVQTLSGKASSGSRHHTKRTVPPAPLQYDDIDCNFNPSFKTVTSFLWIAAITKACNEWFDPAGPPYTSPTLYLYEGQSVSITVGPLAHEFQFAYHVRGDPNVPWDSWHQYSANQCITDLVSYLYEALAPDAAGLMTPFGLCFDTSGFDTASDGNAPIWFSLTSPAS